MRAIEQVLGQGGPRTPDLGGKASDAEKSPKPSQQRYRAPASGCAAAGQAEGRRAKRVTARGRWGPARPDECQRFVASQH